MLCYGVASLVTDIYSVTAMGLCNRCSVTVPNAQPRNAVPERSERLPNPGTPNLGRGELRGGRLALTYDDEDVWMDESLEGRNENYEPLIVHTVLESWPSNLPINRVMSAGCWLLRLIQQMLALDEALVHG